MKLHDPQPNPGAHRPPRRVGRGTKGQKSRAGSGIPAWFEGGQTPLHVRTPKLHGFKNRFRVEYDGVNLGRLAGAAAGTLITPDVLRHDQIVRDRKTRPMPIKILGGGDAPNGVTVHAHAFTRSALDKLAAAGSTAQLISWPDGLPVEAAEPGNGGPGAAERGVAKRKPSGKAAAEPAEPAEPAELAEAAAPDAVVQDQSDAPADEAQDGPDA
jgi:large subunit ribosomal protein L15